MGQTATLLVVAVVAVLVMVMRAVVVLVLIGVWMEPMAMTVRAFLVHSV
jgi:hypothetical protein